MYRYLYRHLPEKIAASCAFKIAGEIVNDGACASHNFIWPTIEILNYSSLFEIRGAVYDLLTNEIETELGKILKQTNHFIAEDCANMALRIAIKNENSIRTVIVSELQSIQMPPIINYKKAIEEILGRKNFEQMSVSSLCWCFWKFRNLINNILPSEERKVCEMLLLKSFDRPELEHFTEWITGANYSCDNFMSSMSETKIISPLIVLIYQYLSSPSPLLVSEYFNLKSSFV